VNTTDKASKALRVAPVKKKKEKTTVARRPVYIHVHVYTPAAACCGYVMAHVKTFVRPWASGQWTLILRVRQCLKREFRFPGTLWSGGLCFSIGSPITRSGIHHNLIGKLCNARSTTKMPRWLQLLHRHSRISAPLRSDPPL